MPQPVTVVLLLVVVPSLPGLPRLPMAVVHRVVLSDAPASRGRDNELGLRLRVGANAPGPLADRSCCSPKQFANRTRTCGMCICTNEVARQPTCTNRMST